MSTTSPTLAELEASPYLDDDGQLSDRFAGQVGVYAIFDRAQTLQYVGYSRNVGLSLKQHLVRQPQQCYWFKVQTIDRPNRTTLEAIRDAWIAENGSIPMGNAEAKTRWEQPIDAKEKMTTAEQEAYAASDELGKIKTLKKVARRVEEEVLTELNDRGVKVAIRFDPKAKEEGLLDLR